MESTTAPRRTVSACCLAAPLDRGGRGPGPFAASVGSAVYWSPANMRSSARLYVDADAILTPLLKGLAADSAPNSQLEVLQRTLLSRPNLDKLISKTDLDLSLTGPPERERLLQELSY